MGGEQAAMISSKQAQLLTYFENELWDLFTMITLPHLEQLLDEDSSK